MLSGMRNRFVVVLAWALLHLVPTGCSRADAPPAAEHPYPGITFRKEVRADPAQRLYWATIDLTDPRVTLHVARGGDDPDGDGKWQTTLMPPTQVAAREGFELTINGDFFEILKATDEPPTPAGQQPHYHDQQWASVLGPAASDGKAWAATTSRKPRPCLVVGKSGKVTIEPLAAARANDAEVIAGNVMLVHDGKPVPLANAARHPRTVVGLDAKGATLTILVVDGRRTGVAEGMSYAELSKEMIAAGCDRAINLDGGGSSEMVIREGERQVAKNEPSNEKERPVANVLGVDVRDAK